jgi:hypothetical protein
MTQTAHRHDRSPLAALNAENSRAIQNVREDSSAATSDWRAWFDGDNMGPRAQEKEYLVRLLN